MRLVIVAAANKKRLDALWRVQPLKGQAHSILALAPASGSPPAGSEFY
jgi:hypothetical protein